jgi:predicted GNAT family acetyltransferase
MDWTFEPHRIYSTDDNGDMIAETTLVPHADGVVDIAHTYVVPTLRGRGVADEMMHAVAAHIRSRGQKAVASCSYAYLWLKRHAKTYADILADGIDDQTIACRIDGRH